MSPLETEANSLTSIACGEDSNAADSYYDAKTCISAETSINSQIIQPEKETKTHFSVKDNPLNKANFLSVATIWWLHPLLKRGYKAPLDEGSIWDLPTADQARGLQEKFDAAYTVESQKALGQTDKDGSPKRPNVNLAIWESVKYTCRRAFCCHLVSAGFTLFQPFLIKAILKDINGEENALGISSGVLVGTQMGLTVALVVVAAQVAIMCGAFFTAKRIGYYRSEISTTSAKRLKVTNEMLQGIRVVKFYGWEDFVNNYIREIRDKEVALMRKYNYLRLANTVLMYMAPTLLSLVCFTTTIMLGNGLDITTTFAVLALSNACSKPFGSFAEASVAVTEAIASTKRLSGFLVAEEIADSSLLEISGPSSPVISIQDSDFQWEDTASMPTLTSINLTLQPGSLTIVVGGVGSGKSSLVNAILGEMQQVGGARVVQGGIAYASQQAWIQNQTVRDNILFGEPFDAEYYRSVISACQLMTDFAMLEQGDQTEIGERGINLSGGQRARISVARALYHTRKLDFVVLDDPLSALDVHVANTVFSDGLRGITKTKTRLLVLNSHYHLLQHADRVLVMSGGRIVGDGKLAEVQTDFPFLLTSPRAKQSRISEVGGFDDDIPKTRAREISQAIVMADGKESDPKKVTSGKLIAQEDRQVGSVQLQTYVDYLSSSGWNGYLLCGSIVALFTIAQVTLFSSDWFLSQWARGSVGLSQMNSLALFVGIVVCATLLVYIRCFFYIKVCMACSTNIHFKYLQKVMAAPITTFFDVTPVGRILNRFSRDLDEVDNSLSYMGLWLLLCIFQVAASMVVCAAVNAYMLIVYVPVGYGCWIAVRVFQSSARELKRFDSVTRSPILNLVSETISGIETVRSYKMVKPFSTRCEELVNYNAKFLFASQAASRWFDMRTDWLVSVIIGAVGILSISAKSTVGASIAGLSLTYAVQLTGNFQRMTTLTTQVENIMTCFERIAHYDSLDEEGYKCVPTSKHTLAPDWPRTGAVEFTNVAMRYRDDLPLVLKGVSFSVASGEKVGICGRTGSGKSSLMSVLFRVVELSSGCVCIDGVDIASITVHQLRTKLIIIPQDPMLFSGSLRMNLDPFAEQSDAQLWDVLRKVHLADTVLAWGRGLDYEVAEKGENLSVGQRQLLCIARALIHDSKVIVMDEATANVDQESDKLIQQTVKESFGGGDRTVLCIAHRIETIMDSDKILVLDAGEVAEYDTPSALLEMKGGTFRALVESTQQHRTLPLSTTNMAKERFIPSPFGSLKLTDADKVALKEFAYNFYDAQVAKYEASITDGTLKVDEREWKHMKTKEGTRVYVERNEVTRESIGGVAINFPALLLTGTTWGTVDDCMFGAIALTTEDMYVKASYVKDMSGGSVLAVLEEPTAEEPFRSMTIRWIELDLPLASTPLINNRDYVYIEYMNMVHLSNGERIGCQIYHSVSFPQTGPLPGRVRANMTVCGIFRQLGPDLVEMYGSGVVDPAGDMIKALVVPSMAAGYLTILKYAHCSEMKKITWLLQKRKASGKEFNAQNRPPFCVTCTTSISKLRTDFGRSEGSSCKLCDGYLCRSCRVHRKISIVGLNGRLDQHKITFCGRCLQQVREMSPLGIIREHALNVGKQAVSYASTESCISTSFSVSD
ncbi:hypothetical protein BBP00_00001541 [Phytophthora kernoviae]|uniref:Uncharacterized protein n=2 Tax=Phytophthora kernoviae TaxID=325452 RepID=A0A3F2RZY2_9STRA|nr:hypothetical protein BBP00_00001541 [Phytophthora kernoviae]